MRRGRRWVQQGDPGRVQRPQHETRRSGHHRRRDDRHHDETGRDRRQDRGGEPVGPGPDRRKGDGIAAPAARGRRYRRAFGGREEARFALLPPARVARHAIARRTDEPPRRRERRVARAVPGRIQGHGRLHHPRPVLPRERRTVDPRARQRRGHTVRGELFRLARRQEPAVGGREEAAVGGGEGRGGRAGMGPIEPEGEGQQVEGQVEPLRRVAGGGGAE
mmetsp:Transcript_7401/g.15722  ORF Transcript_7401/g.15722 Transcript_7401/m.15722 type:complete len:220 (-) Transcript_7401:473-1132(-)